MTSLLLVSPKFPHNIGGAVRALSCFGGGNVYFTGDRIKVEDLKRLPREERMKAYQDTTWAHLNHPRPIQELQANSARQSIINTGGKFDSVKPLVPVAIELLPGSESLYDFDHPENSLYVFGPEDGSLPDGIKRNCHRFVTIPTYHCTNLAAAVYITLYDRMVKRVAAGLEELPNIDSEQRGYWYSESLEQGALP